MSILEEGKAALDELGAANRAFTERYPGESTRRQPVHTVYGGAHLYKSDTTTRLGELAVRAMESHGRHPLEFAYGVGFVAKDAVDRKRLSALQAIYEREPKVLRSEHFGAWLAFTVYERVLRKLQREAVEDFRIDFEDGFGVRSDEEEDQAARSTAREVALAMRQGTLPPFIGIRLKSFGEEWKARGARTLEIFLDNLLEQSGGRLPDNFVVTLPKITLAAQPRALVRLFELLEQRHGLPPSALKMELVIETTQALLGADGRSPLPGFLEAAEGRCVAAHFGTYDFTASCDVTAAHQAMTHPWCELAKGMMKLAYAGTGIFLSDGATNVMPVGPHRGEELSAVERDENRSAVHSAWQLTHRHIRRSLESGFYQGWDLHPAQLPVRYGTCFSFFLEGFAQAAERLRSFVEKAAQATLVGGVFDDAATGQGLLNYFLRALNCGAIDPDDMAQTGLTKEEIALRSFARILSARRARLAGGGDGGSGPPAPT